jgi:phosphonate transport system ATP-binding protein
MTAALAAAAPPARAAIRPLRIEALAKVYPTGKRALDGIDLTVDRQDVVAVIGSSGAGKSTLIRCINRLVEPTAGRIVLGEVDLVPLGRRALRAERRRIGMIFQEYNLVDRLTVMENVLSGRLGYVGLLASLRRRFPPEDVRAAFALLDRVGLAGYQDRRADALSGGQRQRVGIARALMQRPDLLLVDEPTASLDPKTARQIMRLIRALVLERGTPALVNIHDVALAQAFADRIVGLKDGRVVFDGPPASLSAEALSRIYGAEDWTRTIREAEDEEGEAETSPRPVAP